MKIRYIPLSPSQPAGLLQKLIALVVLVGVVALVLTFALVLIPVILLGVAYLWWKTRHVREQLRQMQAQMQQMRQSAQRDGEVFEGEIIEGEIVREHSSDIRIGR